MNINLSDAKCGSVFMFDIITETRVARTLSMISPSAAKVRNLSKILNSKKDGELEESETSELKRCIL